MHRSAGGTRVRHPDSSAFRTHLVDGLHGRRSGWVIVRFALLTLEALTLSNNPTKASEQRSTLSAIHVLVRLGANIRVVQALNQSNEGQEIDLQNIHEQRLAQVRQHVRVREGPESNQRAA